MNYDLRGFYTSSFVNGSSVFSCFGTRSTGDGKDEQSATKLLTSLGIEAKRIVYPHQTHSIHITDVDTSKNDNPPDTDGLVTTQKSVALTVITADCVPVIYHNVHSGRVGISHQGWRGLRSGMPYEMVKKMTEDGGGADEVRAAIGPAIGGCCYEVSEVLYHEMKKIYTFSDQGFATVRDEKYYLSLNNLCYLQLTDAGIPGHNIDFFPFCTSCNGDKFYSFRRDGIYDKRRLFSIIIKVSNDGK